MTAKTARSQKKRPTPKPDDAAVPLIEHLHELRKRAFYCGVSVGLVGTGAYFVQQRLVNMLLWPTHGQQFIYTSVGGGISFLFKLCIYIGIAICLPLIAYHLLRYLQPLLRFESRRFIAISSIVCGILALSGMAFGYFIGLPAALHFLLHQFSSKQIHPLLTIQEYMSFVTAYMLGSALLFQIPLVLLFINRIKPLSPRRLWHYERWVILGAFVASGLMNPTPEIVSQLALAGPIIIMYQIGIIIIWRLNRGRLYSPQIRQLVEHDGEVRAIRKEAAAKSIREPVPELEPRSVAPLQLAADPFEPVASQSAPIDSAVALPMNVSVAVASEPAAVVPAPQSAPPRRPIAEQYLLPRRRYVMDIQAPMQRAIE
jgi:sec-independent protein translocase protein TatC